MKPDRMRALLWTGSLCLGTVLAAGLSVASTVQVSQKRRMFEPREITIARGERLTFLNDDGELLHHVFVDDPRFSFDIGEQDVGARNSVAFPVAGTFRIQCRIHPRMLLAVTVR